jgi:hypothetical protein
MNERIQELALEVFSFKYKTDPNELNPGHHMDHLYKFAELILKDVFNRFGDEILSLHYLEQGCCQDSVHLLKSKIQEHFGVKE